MDSVLRKEESSPQERMTDAELIEGLQEGTRESYRELERRLYTPQCYGVAMRILRNPEDVKDVVQEVFIRVFKYIDGFKEGGNFDGWLFTITKNVSLGFAKKRFVRRAESYEEFFPRCAYFDVSRATDFFNPRPFGENVDVILERENTRTRLVAIMKSLVPEFKDALWKFYMEGKSYKVIAEELDIPVGTVMSRLYRARNALREALEGDVELREQLAA